MTYYIWRGDVAASPAPGNDAANTVVLTEDDGAVVCLGTKMFSSSDLAVIHRAEQERQVGRRSYNRFGDISRSAVSHGNTLNIGFDGIAIPDEVFVDLDQFTINAIGDLIFARQLIVSQNADKTATGAYIAPATIRAL